MSDINVTTISGRLTKDPELRGSERNVCALSVASNRSFRKGSDAEWQEETTYVDVTAFNGTANRCAAKLKKGSFVTVSGRLELNKWEAADGSNRQQLRIVVQNIVAPDFFVKGNDDGDGEAPSLDTDTTPVSDDGIPF
jgi:single-strand DNA-binding protein